MLILRRLQNQPVDWALTGSMAFALQGIPYHPADIDIQTTKAGAFAIHTLLSEFEVDPVRLRSDRPHLRSYLGRLEIGGVQVEVMGDFRKRLFSGTWTPQTNIARHRRFIRFGAYQVPIFSISYEVGSYRAMGRVDKANTLHNYIHLG